MGKVKTPKKGWWKRYCKMEEKINIVILLERGVCITENKETVKQGNTQHNYPRVKENPKKANKNYTSFKKLKHQG